MRKRFNLDLSTLDEMMILIHGGYGKGKTHLGGDMLRTEMAHGPVKYINVRGEDGFTSIARFGLGDVAETCEDYNDLKAVRDELRQKPARAVVLDSAKQVGSLIAKSITGSDRPLRTGNTNNEYGPFNWEIDHFFKSLRGCAQVFMVICPSDKSVDQLSGDILWTPDLPGRNAVGSAGWFDFVFVLDAKVIGPNKVARRLITGPESNIVTRTRLPQPLPTQIEVPEGGGGWQKLRTAIETTFKQGGTK
jgi:hypothetical protein